MKRILVILGILVLVVSACSAPAQPTEAPVIEAVAPEPVQPTAVAATEVVASEPAILSEIENDVAVRAKNEADWKSVTTVELVSDGGSVRTQTDSHARLDLPNGNVLWIGSGTIFELSNIDGQDWVIYLEQGFVLLEVTADHLGGALIQTPLGIAWPTGSMLGVNHDPTTNTMDVGCFKGSCAAAPGDFSKESFSWTFGGGDFFGAVQTIINPIYLRDHEQYGHRLPREPEPMDTPKWRGLVGAAFNVDFTDNEVSFLPALPLGNGNEETTAPQPAQCDLFQGATFSHVYGEFLPGAPLAVNIKMPASVAWQDLDYKMKIGDVEGQACAPLEGNNTRLSCKIKLPSAYVGTYKHHLSLHQDGCEEPIYTKGPLSLPVPEPSEKPKDEGEDDTNTCDAYAPDQIACESGGGIWDLVFFSCTCP